MPKKIDMKGLTIGSIFVKEESKERLEGNKSVRWLCVCLECGKEFESSQCNLKNKKIKNCGCCDRQYHSKGGVISHGHYIGDKASPTYQSWRSLRSRVLRKKDKRHETYKHFTIQLDWITSFEAFLRDMGERPEGTTLDRIDNTKGYDKENCRWATITEQNNNKSNNRFLTVRGIKKTHTQWSFHLKKGRSYIGLICYKKGEKEAVKIIDSFLANQ